MVIQHKETGNKGSFFIMMDENVVAEITYSLPGPGIMIIDHTEVEGSLKGKNVGSQLLDQTVEYARSKSLKIKPYCSFARKVLQKRREELLDVLYLEA
ncbi:MAG: GNAT family N-acetyltransferase [Ferruginibacter sp.]